MTDVHAIEPQPSVGGILPGAQFIDAYRVTVEAGGLDAVAAARLMLERPPAWVQLLMALRNALVTPFGLKTGPEASDRRPKIGIFPIESENPDRVVLGFDDKHLDFRVVVDVAAAGAASEVTATTLVRRHNLLGRAYLATILPFHKLIVRASLSGVAARHPGQSAGSAGSRDRP